MRFHFEVGEYEKHLVIVNYDQFVGNLRISVDGHEVVSQLSMFSFSLVKKYEFIVGVNEKHLVRIEKERKLFFAGLRNQKWRVYIDDRLITEHEGM